MKEIRKIKKMPTLITHHKLHAIIDLAVMHLYFFNQREDKKVNTQARIHISLGLE